MFSSIRFALFIMFIFYGCTSQKKEKAIDPDEYQEDTEAENKITTCKQDTSMVSESQKKHGPHYYIVEIKQMKFQPFEVTVHKGDTIVWINRDITTHDVTEITKAWTSSPLPSGKSWLMIAKNGADYYCSLHEVMKGKIIVE